MLHNMINIGKWNELPKAYQSIIRSASHVANEWMMAKYDSANPAALKRLVAGGAKLQPFSAAILDASHKAAMEVYDETNKANAEFKKVYDSYMAFRNDQYLWWQVTEYAFDTYMIRARARG
jgi:TRAP-type mannitol/chloroaromatic compound transport system substrate-binding protein